MTRDPVRDLIRPSLPPVADVETARRRIEQRAVRMRRRDRRRTVLAAAAGIAAVAVGLVLLPPGRSDDRRPAVGTSSPPAVPSEETVLPACVDSRLDERIVAYVSRWGEAAIEGTGSDGLCVLAGRPGPAPAFETSSLGTEIPLDPTDAGDGLDPHANTPDHLVEEGMPAIHLGRVGRTDHHAFVTWQLPPRRGSPVICLEGACTAGADVPSEGATISQGDALGVSTWVDPEVAVVAVALNGEPAGWQQPIARAASLVFADAAPRVQEIGLTMFDADGNVLSHETYDAS